MSELGGLMERVGVEAEFKDALGEIRRTDTEIARHLLKALGFDAADEDAARTALEALEDETTRKALPPVVVTTKPSERLSIPLNAPEGFSALDWEIIDENGASQTGEASVEPADAGEGSSATRRFGIDAPKTFGRYRLRVEGEGVPSTETTLVVAPATCWTPEGLGEGQSVWGISLQLYLLRSDRNWGIGDFGDLKRFVEIAAGLGADVIGLNPLHAMFPDDPEHASPYSPASRLFLNALYIDVTSVSGFDDPAVRTLVEEAGFRDRLAECRAAELVDYAGVARLKFPVLEALHRVFRAGASAADREGYAAFRREQGEALERFCRFLALREHFALQAPEQADWRRWPEPFRDCRSEAVERFAAERAERIDFFAWTQWIADLQLAEAAAVAEARGMGIGLYRDLAVGADAAGAEGWANPSTVLSSALVGAPPDILNPAGQNWALPPFHPGALRDEAYRSFVALVRANMRHAGGLRIDHVMALQHLYLIPEGRAPSEGAYVAYPMDDLIAVLALESRRNRCLVVGEDLGTVPEGFRDRMEAARILSYRVVFFERSENGAFIPPQEYPPLALAVLGSHDLATLRGWWEARDVKLKAELGLYPSAEEEARQLARRDEERQALIYALVEAEILPAVDAGSDIASRLPKAAHAFLARTRSALAVVQIEDLLGETDQVNLPGTIEEHPNWRRKYGVSIEEVASEPKVRELASTLNRRRS